jgi:predicted small integral membrane protein
MERVHMPRSNAIPDATASRWQCVGSLPVAAATLVALNGLYMVLVAFGNITDFGTNQAFVQHVLAMDTTNFGAEPGTHLDADVMWRAITSETLQNIAYVGLIVWEVATALVMLVSVQYSLGGT